MWNPFRKRDKVEIVRPIDALRAKERLQRQVGFDIDKFLDNETPDVLFHEPLGPTLHCLSITQIGDLVEGKLLAAEVLRHAAQCGDCRREIADYRALTEHDWETPAMEAMAAMIELPFAHAIRIPEGGNFFLVMANRGEAGFLREIDPASVIVAGAIEAKGCSIAPHQTSGYDASEAIELHFKDFKVNAPKGQKEICNWLEIEARTKGGKLRKREFVRVFQEAEACGM